MYCDGKRRAPCGQARLYQTQYTNAKTCARNRGIEWLFTYDTWVDWWGDDIDNRGCKVGQLVMARTGDVGPYHPDNVRKATKAENNIEGRTGRKHSTETRVKMQEAWTRRKEKDLI